MAPLDTSKFLNKWVEIPVSYNKRDLLTYAVGIGCDELRWVYENDEDFAMFPTYPIVLNFKGTDQDVVSFPSEAMMKSAAMIPLEGAKVFLDGERSIEKLAEMPVEGGEFMLRTRVIGISKRGSGASVESETIISQAGKDVYKIISGAFMVGARNFSDSGISNSEKVDVPSRKPDAVLEMPTSVTQAQIYRLSGDYNPLHVDPNSAAMSGFKKPILHGLCSFGISARAALKTFGDNDAKRFRLFKGRFAKTVDPGDTLIVEMWKDGERVIVQTKSKATGQVVINNAYLLLNPAAKI